MQVDTTRAGHRDLLAFLTQHRVSTVGIEASGGYERTVLAALCAAGLHVVLLQPRQVRAFAQYKRRRAKNDRLDAGLIAECVAGLTARRAGFRPPSRPVGRSPAPDRADRSRHRAGQDATGELPRRAAPQGADPRDRAAAAPPQGRDEAARGRGRCRARTGRSTILDRERPGHRPAHRPDPADRHAGAGAALTPASRLLGRPRAVRSRLGHAQGPAPHRWWTRQRAACPLRGSPAGQLPLERGAVRTLPASGRRREAAQKGADRLRPEAAHLCQRPPPARDTVGLRQSHFSMVAEPVEGSSMDITTAWAGEST